MAIKSKRAGVSAPAKPKGKRNGYQVNLSDEERELVDTEAHYAGLKRSTLTRTGAIAEARRLRALRLGPAGSGA